MGLGLANRGGKKSMCMKIQKRGIKRCAMMPSVSVFIARCTLAQTAKRGIAIACCLSLCLSVTLVNCDHIGWNSSKIISSLVSLGCSLFATPT